jgi:hypothetical protein
MRYAVEDSVVVRGNGGRWIVREVDPMDPYLPYFIESTTDGTKRWVSECAISPAVESADTLVAEWADANGMAPSDSSVVERLTHFPDGMRVLVWGGARELDDAYRDATGGSPLPEMMAQSLVTRPALPWTVVSSSPSTSLPLCIERNGGSWWVPEAILLPYFEVGDYVVLAGGEEAIAGAYRAVTGTTMGDGTRRALCACPQVPWIVRSVDYSTDVMTYGIARGSDAPIWVPGLLVRPARSDAATMPTKPAKPAKAAKAAKAEKAAKPAKIVDPAKKVDSPAAPEHFVQLYTAEAEATLRAILRWPDAIDDELTLELLNLTGCHSETRLDMLEELRDLARAASSGKVAVG